MIPKRQSFEKCDFCCHQKFLREYFVDSVYVVGHNDFAYIAQ